MLKVMPQSVSSEKALLGCALIDSDSASWLVDNMSEAMFYSEKNRTIFRAICKLVEDRQGVDLVTAFSRLRDDGAEIGTVALRECTEAVSTTDHVDYYGRVVQKKYYEREMIKSAQKIVEGSKGDHLNNMARISLARAAVDGGGFITSKSAAHKIMNRLESGKSELMKFGLANLDTITGGHSQGDLVTVGARTGYGKTAFLASVAMNFIKRDVSVGYLAGEMGADQVMTRMLSNLMTMPHGKLRAGNLDLEERLKAQNGLALLSDYPINFACQESPTIKDIKDFAEATQSRVIMVDYLTRCQLPRGESYRISVLHFMRELKNFAMKTNRLVVLAAQLNRLLDGAQDREPRLSDFQESSAIEQESDCAILLHMSAEEKDKPGEVDLRVIVGKNRHGPVGRDRVTFNKTFMRIS